MILNTSGTGSPPYYSVCTHTAFSGVQASRVQLNAEPGAFPLPPFAPAVSQQSETPPASGSGGCTHMYASSTAVQRLYHKQWAHKQHPHPPSLSLSLSLSLWSATGGGHVDVTN